MALSLRSGERLPMLEAPPQPPAPTVQRHSRPSLFRPSVVLLLVVGLAVEALLAVRLWAQLTGVNADTGLMRLVFDATNSLVEPFRNVDPVVSTRSEAVLEITTLEAMQVYLVVLLVALVALIVLNLAVSLGLHLWSMHRYSRLLSGTQARERHL